MNCACLRSFVSGSMAFLLAWAPTPEPTARGATLPPATRQAACAAELPVPEGLAAGDWASICEAHEAGRLAAHAVEGGYRARNPGLEWATRFDGRGFTTTPDEGGWTWGLELQSYGIPGAERALKGRSARVHVEGARVAYTWDETLEEWYVNEGGGLEHGYTLRQRPEGFEGVDGPLTLTLAVRGGLQPEVLDDGRGACFVDQGGAVALTYDNLAVFDAEGRSLPACVERSDEGLRLVVREHGAPYPLTIDPIVQRAYLKPSFPDGARPSVSYPGEGFGCSVSISGDTVVVGAELEESNAVGVNGDESDTSLTVAGAAFVFVRTGGTWTQQAYLKASNNDFNPYFGYGFGGSVSISGDTVVVGAIYETSSAVGVDGNQSDHSAWNAGAAYVFVRNGTTWTQQAYLKASNTDQGDGFGTRVSVSGDTLVVAANGESSNATGVDGDQTDNSVSWAGAAYVFVRNGTTWTQQAYLKPSHVDYFYNFGWSASVSGDTVVIGARGDSSNATGVNGDETDTSAPVSGAAYVFVRNGTTWTQQAYLKASNTEAFDEFGTAVAVSGDTVVVGAYAESSAATGVNGDQSDNSAYGAGAAYVFVRSGTTWTQQAYLKASNIDAYSPPGFGNAISISGDTLVIGASSEASSTRLVNGNQHDISALHSGAAYVFARNGTTATPDARTGRAPPWMQLAYLKAANAEANDQFGFSVSVSGDTVVVGAVYEDGGVGGVNGDRRDNSQVDSGAAYVFDLKPNHVRRR